MTNIYKRLYAGFLLVLLDINLERIDMLPDPLGYWLILIGFMMLSKKEKSLDHKIGCVISGLMLTYSIYQYIANIGAGSGHLTMLSYLSTVVTMILSASLCFITYRVSIRNYRYRVKQARIKKLMKEADQYIIINALAILAFSTVMIVPANFILGMTITIAIVVFVLQVRFILTLKRIKKQWITWAISPQTIDLEV